MSHSKNHNSVFTKQTATLYSNQAEAVQAETLYSEHFGKVKAFLISRCQSSEMVDEVSQDLYLKLMSIEDLSSINNPASYLMRMAYNLMIDALRRQGRDDNRTSSEPGETQEITDKQPSPFEATLSDQRLAMCEKALAELPDEFREVLLLNRLEGFTHKQIAEKYSRSTSWVEKTIVRTVLHCRQKLEWFDK